MMTVMKSSPRLALADVQMREFGNIYTWCPTKNAHILNVFVYKINRVRKVQFSSHETAFSPLNRFLI
jgi:hypothetical protein